METAKSWSDSYVRENDTVNETQGSPTSWVFGPISREGHLIGGGAAVECEMHGLNCVTLLGGGKSKGSAAQDEGDSWKCEFHGWLFRWIKRCKSQLEGGHIEG